MYPNKNHRVSNEDATDTPRSVKKSQRHRSNGIHGTCRADRVKGSNVTIFSLWKIWNAKNLNSIESKSFKRIEKRENKSCKGLKEIKMTISRFPRVLLQHQLHTVDNPTSHPVRSEQKRKTYFF